MCKILLSINPRYVEKILSGEKKYEFRTRIAKRKVDSILIYSTAQVKRDLAEVTVKKVLKGSPDELWDITEKYSGIDKKFFDKYFTKRELAYAYELGEITRFENPKKLSEFGCINAPQSFIYIY